MTTDEKHKMGVGLMQYRNDVYEWHKAEEEPDKKKHYQELMDAIDLLLDSFKEGLETDEW